MNSKGANVIFTSIMIILLSVAAMIIIIGLIVPFFTSLKEEINFNHNKENLILINQELVELKTNDINTFKNLNLDVVDEIVFDATTNTVYIKQKIANNSFKNFKDVNYGNLSIVKANGLMIFTLYLDGIVTLNETTVINNNFTLKATIVDIVNDVRVISITQYLGQVYLTISPTLNTFIRSLEITLTATPTDANIYYTTDGTEPTESSTLYTEPFTITESTTIKARAYSNHYTSSPIISRKYFGVLVIDSLDITPNDGVFVISKIVTATSVPEDTNIYYTTDGNDPDENSTLYSGPLTITEGGTYKFKAFKTKYTPSEIITRIFTEITGLSFYNQYDQNTTTTDISDKNNVIINHNISFDSNGAVFDNNANNYLFIENDWNDSHTSLNLGNNNFTLEAFVSGDYTGSILSKNSYVGGLQLKIDENKKVNFSFSGYDQIRYPYYLDVDENYVYVVDYGNQRIEKRRKDNWELVLISGGPKATAAIDGYNAPYAVTVDDTYIYITDYGNHRMVKRNKSDLSYVSMISGGAGAGDNQLYNPKDIAVDNNYLYIIDGTYHRIKIYDKNSYTLIGKIGGNPVLGGAPVSPYYGSGDYQFYTPSGIAVDDNYIYVTEETYHRIKKYDKNTFAFISKACGTSSGSGNDQMNTPRGISVDDNYIYIADYSNARIMIRNKDLNMTYYNKITGMGDFFSGFYLQYIMDVDNDENYLYATPNYLHRVAKFSKSSYDVVSVSSGYSVPEVCYCEETTNWVSGTNGAMTTNTTTLKGRQYSLNLTKSGTTVNNVIWYNQRLPIQNFTDKNLTGWFYIKDTTTLNKLAENSALEIRYGITLQLGVYDDNDYYKYTYNRQDLNVGWNYINFNVNSATAIGNPIITDLDTLSFKLTYVNASTTTAAGDIIIDEFQLTNYSVDELTSSIYGITSDDNYIYYADAALNRVVKRRISDMAIVGIIGENKPKNTKYSFNSPFDVDVDDNYLYVTDHGSGSVKKYNKNTLEWVYTCTVTNMTYPTGIKVDGNYMYVVTNYSSTRHYLFKIAITANSCTLDKNIGGAYGSGIYQFRDPVGVEVDDTSVYVADSYYNRVKKYLKSDLSYVSQLGYTAFPNYFPNTLYTPFGVLYDNNYLYVSDIGYGFIRKYTTDFNYVSSIGFQQGYAPDELYLPRGLTISNGQMYVAESSNAQIIKRDLKEFDVNVSFAGAGTDFNYNYGSLSIDSDENYYYILNHNIHRLEKRNKSDLALVAYVGGPYAVGTSTVTSARANFFSLPNDILVDGNYLYVSDRSNHRVARFYKSDLSFDTQFGDGTAGATTARLSSPRQVAVNDSNIYIADTGNNRIVVLNKSDMNYITAYGTTGTGVDNFSSICGIAVDDNYIYTAEYGNHRIKKIDKTTFAYVTHLGGTAAGSGDNQFNTPYYISLDTNYIYVGDSGNNRIKKHLKSDLSYVSKIGSSGMGNDNFRNPYGVRYKDENTLLVSDTTNNRFHIRNPSDLSYVSMIDYSTYTTDGLYNPFGVTVDDNYLYITDLTNNRVVKKNKTDLSTVATIGNPIAGSGNDQFSAPYGIAGDDNYIYINDYSNCRIVKRNKSDLSYVSKLSGGCVNANTAVRYNTGIAVDDNNVYITETTYHRIKIFNKNTFAYVGVIGVAGVSGTGNDQFSSPRGIAVDDNYIYIVDSGNHRIHKRNKTDYSLVEMYGVGVAGALVTNSFNTPYGIAVYNDRVYITDYGNYRIKVYDTNFNYLYKFGRYGWGQDQLNGPTDIAVDDDYVYIAEYSNSRVVKRAFSDLINIENIPKTNFVGINGVNINMLSSNSTISGDSQIVIKRSGYNFCMYINGVLDKCKSFIGTPTYLTFPEMNTRYNTTALITTYTLGENQNNYAWGIGNYGQLLPGNGHLKYLRLFDTNLSDSDINALYQSYK